MEEVSGMTNNALSRQQLFKELYRDVFPAVAYFISKKNGTFEDARDIFQDALMIFYERNLTQGFQFHSSKEAYLLGIAKHLWYRKYNKEHNHIELTYDGFELPELETETINAHGVLMLLEKAGKKCLNLLHTFYYEQTPLKQISKSLGFSSEHSATVQKYKCLEKIRDAIKAKSVTYADFLD